MTVPASDSAANRRPAAAIIAGGVALLLVALGTHAAGSAPGWLLAVTAMVAGAHAMAATSLGLRYLRARIDARRRAREIQRSYGGHIATSDPARSDAGRRQQTPREAQQ